MNNFYPLYSVQLTVTVPKYIACMSSISLGSTEIHLVHITNEVYLSDQFDELECMFSFSLPYTLQDENIYTQNLI